MKGMALKTNHHEDGRDDLDERKRLKVKLPVRQHLQLHRIKVLEGQNLSETVRQALDAFFEELEEDEQELEEDGKETGDG